MTLKTQVPALSRAAHWPHSKPDYADVSVPYLVPRPAPTENLRTILDSPPFPVFPIQAVIVSCCIYFLNNTNLSVFVVTTLLVQTVILSHHSNILIGLLTL